MGTVDTAAGDDAQSRQGPVPHYREPVPNSATLPPTRTTRQRKAVADLLSELHDFRSAQQIHAILGERGDNIGLATVYRALGVMMHSGHVDVLTREDGETVYLQCSDHHHLLCRSCGRSVEIAGQAVLDWADAVADQHGYTQITHALELSGLCPECSPADPTAHGRPLRPAARPVVPSRDILIFQLRASGTPRTRATDFNDASSSAQSDRPVWAGDPVAP